MGMTRGCWPWRSSSAGWRAEESVILAQALAQAHHLDAANLYFPAVGRDAIGAALLSFSVMAGHDHFAHPRHDAAGHGTPTTQAKPLRPLHAPSAAQSLKLCAGGNK